MIVIHCRKCRRIEHNVVTCKNPPKSSNVQQTSQQPVATEQPFNQQQQVPTKRRVSLHFMVTFFFF